MFLARSYSHYSLLSAIPKIEKLILKAKEKGYTAVALCDEDTTSGLVEFFETCQKNEIKPVLGTTLRMQNVSLDKAIGSVRGFSKVAVLAKNKLGYNRLLELVTIARTILEKPVWHLTLQSLEPIKIIDQEKKEAVKIETENIKKIQNSDQKFSQNAGKTLSKVEDLSKVEESLKSVNLDSTLENNEKKPKVLPNSEQKLENITKSQNPNLENAEINLNLKTSKNNLDTLTIPEIIEKETKKESQESDENSENSQVLDSVIPHNFLIICTNEHEFGQSIRQKDWKTAEIILKTYREIIGSNLLVELLIANSKETEAEIVQMNHKIAKLCDKYNVTYIASPAPRYCESSDAEVFRTVLAIKKQVRLFEIELERDFSLPLFQNLQKQYEYLPNAVNFEKIVSQIDIQIRADYDKHAEEAFFPPFHLPLGQNCDHQLTLETYLGLLTRFGHTLPQILENDLDNKSGENCKDETNYKNNPDENSNDNSDGESEKTKTQNKEIISDNSQKENLQTNPLDNFTQSKTEKQNLENSQNKWTESESSKNSTTNLNQKKEQSISQKDKAEGKIESQTVNNENKNNENSLNWEQKSQKEIDQNLQNTKNQENLDNSNSEINKKSGEKSKEGKNLTDNSGELNGEINNGEQKTLPNNLKNNSEEFLPQVLKINTTNDENTQAKLVELNDKIGANISSKLRQKLPQINQILKLEIATKKDWSEIFDYDDLDIVQELSRIILPNPKKLKSYKDNYWQKHSLAEYITRIDYELNIIITKGYSSYFLVFADIMEFCRNSGIVTNTRGSAAGSMVGYLTNISVLDPIQYILPFERFLNPLRPSPPDIDGDFADNRRQDVIDYITTKYGYINVSQITTFGTMLPRAVVRDVGRVLGAGYKKCDQLSKLIPSAPQGRKTTFDWAFETSKELTQFYEKDEDVRRIIDIARLIEGNLRHASVHAAGVLITPSKLTDYCALQWDSDHKGLACQYDMKICEKVGLVKMDILGITNLSFLGESLALVKQRRNIDIDLLNLDTEDLPTFDLLSKGHTMGIFQLSGPAMTKYLVQLEATKVNDLMAMVALYRPGPMGSIPDYIIRKKNPKKITYPYPQMANWMADSYGLFVYQEDLLYTAIELAGYDWGEVDVLRKGMGKKIQKVIDEQRPKFVSGCQKNGISEEKAEEIWALMVPFGAYGFNKAHSSSYGMVSFWTAFMKANFSAEFMTALMTSEMGNMEKTASAIIECQQIGLIIATPDVNLSEAGYEIENDQVIRYGLASVKNLGSDVIKFIITERKNGKYQSLDDFLERMSKFQGFNKRSLEALISSGSLDLLGQKELAKIRK